MQLHLSATDREDLERMVRATSAPAGAARRARSILLLAEGHRYAEICTRLGVTDRLIARWKRRYTEGGVLALLDAPRAGRQNRISPALEAKILRLTEQARQGAAPLLDVAARGGGGRGEPLDGPARLAAGGPPAAPARA